MSQIPGQHAATSPQAAATQPIVSLVVVSWNTRDLLRSCLESVLAETRVLPGPAEVVVVDNASGDGSAEMVLHAFPSVSLIANTSNNGFAAGTNQGVAASNGRYLLLLNPDTTLTPGSLSALVSFLDSNPGAAAVGPRLVGRHGEAQVSCFPLPTLSRELWRLFHLDGVRARASYSPERLQARTPQAVESIQGACLLVRREALDDAGLLDEQFFVYTEEIDLCRRFTDRGWLIYWIPGAVVVHYGGASTSQVSSRMFLQLYRSKVQYFRKHLGTSGALGYKAVLLLATVPRVVLPALLVGLDRRRRAKWQGLLSNYSSLLAALPAL